jgi:hypothetical protein
MKINLTLPKLLFIFMAVVIFNSPVVVAQTEEEIAQAEAGMDQTRNIEDAATQAQIAQEAAERPEQEAMLAAKQTAQEAKAQALAAKKAERAAILGDSAEKTLKGILKDLKAANDDLPINRYIADLTHNTDFTEEELIALCELAIKKTKPFADTLQTTPAYAQLSLFLQAIIGQLKDYKISGIGFALHPSFSLLYGTSNFNTNFVFKNPENELRNRQCNISYHSFGWQNECVLRFDVIFTVGTKLDAENTRTPLKFNAGFTGGWRLPGITTNKYQINIPLPHFAADLNGNYNSYPFTVAGFTVLPFANTPGSLVIAHFGLGATGVCPLTDISDLHSFNAAVVFSGGTFQANS